MKLIVIIRVRTDTLNADPELHDCGRACSTPEDPVSFPPMSGDRTFTALKPTESQLRGLYIRPRSTS